MSATGVIPRAKKLCRRLNSVSDFDRRNQRRLIRGPGNCFFSLPQRARFWFAVGSPGKKKGSRLSLGIDILSRCGALKLESELILCCAPSGKKIKCRRRWWPGAFCGGLRSSFGGKKRSGPPRGGQPPTAPVPFGLRFGKPLYGPGPADDVVQPRRLVLRK